MTGVTVLKLVDPIYTILMEFESLRELLETLYDRYNRTEFIAPDPISVPHRFEGVKTVKSRAFSRRLSPGATVVRSSAMPAG